MIDRHARKTAALALRQFASGRITNYQMESEFLASSDPAIQAIEGFAWLLYHDLKEHYASGKNALSKTDWKTVARCVLFLRSDEPYTYPPERWRDRSRIIGHLIETFNKITLKRYPDTLGKQPGIHDYGDLSVWPFVCRNDLNRIAGEVANNRKALL